MAKYELKIQARKLRGQGHSIKDIAKSLKISRSTASIWCRDLPLSPSQIRVLLESKSNNITAGRLKGALIQKNKRLERLRVARKEAMRLKKLDKNEFWIAGLALYLAEGSKKMGRVQFTNTDPRIIKFMIRWFKTFFKITKQNMRVSIIINQIHKPRDTILKNYWQKYLKLKLSQFTDTRYVKIKQSKIYSNYDNYFGTFSFRVNKSTDLLYKLNALTDRMLSL